MAFVKTKRDRLIELIQEAVPGVARYWAGLIANHLIENGVEIPVKCENCRFKSEPGQPNILCYHMKDEDYCSYGEMRK